MPDSPHTADIVELIRARAKQHPSEGLMSRQSLNESHVKYGRALLLALADEIERKFVDDDLGLCELCGKPLLIGQFVNQYDDAGTAHANCDAPFAKPTPTPADDGSTMPAYVLLGVPALLESLSESTRTPDPEDAAEIKTLREALGRIASNGFGHTRPR